MNPTEPGSPHQPAPSRGGSCARNQRSAAGLRRAGGGRTASAASRDSAPGAPAPQTRSGAGRGKGLNRGPRAPAAAAPRRGARFLDNRAGHSPSSGTGEGRERRDPLRGGGGARGPSRAQPPRPGSRGPVPPRAAPTPRLPCIPSPGHSPRSETTGCRPPWPRQPARRGRAGGGGRALSRVAAPPPAGPPRLLSLCLRDPEAAPRRPRRAAARAARGALRGAEAGPRGPRAKGAGLWAPGFQA